MIYAVPMKTYDVSYDPVLQLGASQKVRKLETTQKTQLAQKNIHIFLCLFGG